MASLSGEALRHPQSSASSRVNPDTVEKAVNALLKWKDSESKNQKPQLLEQDDFMYLVLTLKKIPPKSRTNAYKIALPHPLHSSSSELCLIIDDRTHKSTKLTSDDAKKKIKSEDIPISKVVKLSKLKSDYKPFEAKRKLCDSYDMFFADKRVVPLLPKLLGKQFFKKKKIPVPVDLTHKNWKEQIDKACSSALLYLRTGTCSVVKVAKVSMESGEIVENVIAAIDGAVEEVVPKKWAGLRSLHLKFSESLPLPIYQALPDMKMKIEGILKKKNIEKEDSDGGELEEIKEDSSKKVEKLGGKKKGSSSKKGRIHEVRYMDTVTDMDQKQELGSDGDAEDYESEHSGHDELGSVDIEGKKRKKAGYKTKGKNKDQKHELGNNDDEEDDCESEQSRDDELGSADFEGKKKRKKGDHKTKGQVFSELTNVELKPSKKLAKVENGDKGKHKKGGLSILKDGEGSDEKKEKKKNKKKKSELGKLKDETVKVKVKKSSKKKQSV